MSVRRPAFLVCALALLASCGSSGNGNTTDSTLALSGLPSSVSSAGTGNTPDPSASTSSLPVGATAGARVAGNKVILIGDSVLASTATRYGGEMCKVLVPLGWQAEVDAETGQFIQWGNDVLTARLSAKWDVAVILLGNNYLGDQAQYKFELERMVKRLSPAIVVLVRVTEFTPNRLQVNAVIDELAKAYPNVITVDWAAATKADKTLTGPDHLHLETKGRQLLSADVAKALGQAPVTPGKCLSTKYMDDSRSPVTGTTVKGTKESTTTSVGETTVPTTDPPTSPAPSPTPTTSGSGGG